MNETDFSDIDIKFLVDTCNEVSNKFAHPQSGEADPVLSEVCTNVIRAVQKDSAKLNKRYIATAWKRAYRKQLLARSTPYTADLDRQSRSGNRRKKSRTFCLLSVTDPPGGDKFSREDVLDLLVQRETRSRIDAWKETLSIEEKALLPTLTGEKSTSEMSEQLNVCRKTITRRVKKLCGKAARDLQEIARP